MNNPDFDAWYAANKATMPYLHRHVYSFLEHIFNHLAKFATDFGNVNVMTRTRPLTELNTKPLTKALTVLKAFEDQLTLAQSTNTPITILAATVSKFSTRTPSINPTLFTQASVPVSTSALLDNSQIQCCDVKRNPSIPDKGAKAAAIQHQKKPPRNGATNPTKQRPVTNMGMFFLTRNDIKATTSSPRTYLPNFTCKGRECTRDSCPYSHPRNACKLPADIIAAIARHFSTKKICWLNEWHFMKLAHLPPHVKAIVGGKDGPSSSKRA
jgi:hypothetical protein